MTRSGGTGVSDLTPLPGEQMPNGRCAFTKADGVRCGGFAIRGSAHCFSHAEEAREARQEARQRGGSTKKVPLPSLSELPLRNFDHVDGALEDLHNALRTGKIGAKEANAILRTIGLRVRIWHGR
mgnify:CR=1 FL=1